jgi:hypothetical protein
MNHHLQTFARNFIKERLKQLPPEQQLFFNRMYSHTKLDATVDEAVDAMTHDKLNWAMQQVETSYNAGVEAGTVRPFDAPAPCLTDIGTAPEGSTWRCRDCFGPIGEDHSENCGVGRGTITRDHCGDCPVENREA